MTQSDTKRDIYQPCEDSPDERSGQAIWPLKTNYKQMKCPYENVSHRGMIIRGIPYGL
jgi:hypothetical protein